MHLSEIALIFLVALIVFSPEKLPMLAKHLGSFIAWVNRQKKSLEINLDSFIKNDTLKENELKAREAEKKYLSSAQEESHQ